MSRRHRLFIWLVGILVLVGLGYASLPWLLAGLIKQNLTARGLADIQLRVDYPGWHGIKLHALTFSAVAGEQQWLCEVPEVEVGYHLMELLTGTVDRIRVPVVKVRSQSAPGSVPSAPSTAALPLATLLSGQWISQLPVRELLLEQLSVDAQISTAAVYTLQLHGQLRDAQLQVDGAIQMPAPKPPIAFSLSARHTGEARVFIAPAAHATEPTLELTINPVARDQERLELHGVLTAKFNTLLPMAVPWFKQAAVVSGLEGELHSQWHAQLTAAHWRIAGEAVVRGLGGRWRELVLPRAELTATYDVDPQRALLHSSLHLADKAVVLQATGLHQFATGHGHADLKLIPVVFSENGFVLSRLLKRWPLPFDITAGRVSGKGQLEWQKTLELHGVVQLDKVGGHYNQLVFAGLSGEVALANGKGVRTTKDAQLRVALVDVGFPVENIAVRFALAANPKAVLPLVRLQHVSAELFGGKAQSGPFELDFGRDKNAFVVQLEGIGLNEILQLEQQEGLQGSGVLDGQLPIEIFSAGLVVTQGQLSARAPGGAIRYTPTEKVAAMAQSNASVNMLVQALSNFQYHLLEVSSDYKPGGDLALQVHLEGKNSAWQGGRPVHLNLNLEENIPTLLRSLQLSDDISEQVRKRYQNSPPGDGGK